MFWCDDLGVSVPECFCLSLAWVYPARSLLREIYIPCLRVSTGLRIYGCMRLCACVPVWVCYLRVLVRFRCIYALAYDTNVYLCAVGCRGTKHQVKHHQVHDLQMLPKSNAKA